MSKELEEILPGVFVSQKWRELVKKKIEESAERVESYKKFIRELEDSLRK
jgi:uncharacterized protein YlzI (FlbEa/FlbD family)